MSLISTKWVKGLKFFHLKYDTTNRVESFVFKLKAYFSPGSSLKETLTDLMSCIDENIFIPKLIADK